MAWKSQDRPQGIADPASCFRPWGCLGRWPRRSAPREQTAALSPMVASLPSGTRLGDAGFVPGCPCARHAAARRGRAESHERPGALRAQGTWLGSGHRAVLYTEKTSQNQRLLDLGAGLGQPFFSSQLL